MEDSEVIEAYADEFKGLEDAVASGRNVMKKSPLDMMARRAARQRIYGEEEIIKKKIAADPNLTPLQAEMLLALLQTKLKDS